MRDFQVTRANHRWKVSLDGEVHGPYLSRKDAVADAIDAAYEAGLEGQKAQVSVHERAREPEVIWTYGVDAYPDRR